MLEHGSLLIGPAGASAARAVHDAGSGVPVGFVCRRASASRPWWAWLAAPVLEVHEQEDAPLVFTVRRRWLRRQCEVRDADGRLVGWLMGPVVGNRHGRRLAVLERTTAGRGVWHGPDGQELGRLESDGGRLCVTFAPAAASDPFLKMLLLAAALTA